MGISASIRLGVLAHDHDPLGKLHGLFNTVNQGKSAKVWNTMTVWGLTPSIGARGSARLLRKVG